MSWLSPPPKKSRFPPPLAPPSPNSWNHLPFSSDIRCCCRSEGQLLDHPQNLWHGAEEAKKSLFWVIDPDSWVRGQYVHDLSQLKLPKPAFFCNSSQVNLTIPIHTTDRFLIVQKSKEYYLLVVQLAIHIDTICHSIFKVTRTPVTWQSVFFLSAAAAAQCTISPLSSSFFLYRGRDQKHSP